MPKPKVVSLCHQYIAMSAVTSMLPCFHIKGWERKRSKCFFTYIHLDLFCSHPSTLRPFSLSPLDIHFTSLKGILGEQFWTRIALLAYWGYARYRISLISITLLLSVNVLTDIRRDITETVRITTPCNDITSFSHDALHMDEWER